MKRPCVRLSVCHHATATAVCGGFAAERRVGGRYRSTVEAPGAAGAGRPTAAAPLHGPQHGAQQQMRAALRLQLT